MNKRFLVLTLIPLALCTVTTNVSAKAEKLWHDVGKETGSYTVTNIGPGPGGPFTLAKTVSTVTWHDHWVYNDIIDGSWNLHVKVKWMSKNTLRNDVWYWNETAQEWIYVLGYSQSLSSVWGLVELYIDLSETQTSIDQTVSKETYEGVYIDPWTGERMTFQYTVQRHMIVKWVNGELQFDKYWEIWKS